MPFHCWVRSFGDLRALGSHAHFKECIICWYSFNIGVLLLNKYLLSNYGLRRRTPMLEECQ
ncbi:hypothetical protein AMTRI_Chr02g214320 [Amborella trichopoda]